MPSENDGAAVKHPEARIYCCCSITLLVVAGWHFTPKGQFREEFFPAVSKAIFILLCRLESLMSVSIIKLSVAYLS